MTPQKSSAPVVFRAPDDYTGFGPSLRVSVTFLDGGRVRLDRVIYWYEPGLRRMVHEGFVTNGTSSPWWAWPLVGHPFSYSLLPASILHDFDLEQQVVLRHESRLDVDRRYHRALRSRGVGRLRAGLIYVAVRVKAIALRRVWDAVPPSAEHTL